jgi:glycosyltransferase 2 family protein
MNKTTSLSASNNLVAALRDSIPRNRYFRSFLRLVLLGLVVWLILVRFDLREIRSSFLRLNPLYLLPVILVLSPLAVWLRAARWRYLLPGGERLPLFAYARAYLIGILANSLLLGKFGDLVKAKLICDTKIDYGRSVAVVLIDRVLEAIALLMLFTTILLTSSLPGWAHRLAWIAGLASLSILVGLRFLFDRRESLIRACERLLGAPTDGLRGRRLLKVVEGLLAGSEALANYRRVLVVLLYSMAVWVVEIVTVAVFLAAFSVPAPWFPSATVILVVLNLGLLIPISPGSVGVYQLLCVFALSSWGVDRELALTLGIVMQAVLFIPLYFAGVICTFSYFGRRDQNSETFGPPALKTE